MVVVDATVRAMSGGHYSVTWHLCLYLLQLFQNKPLETLVVCLVVSTDQSAVILILRREVA